MMIGARVIFSTVKLSATLSDQFLLGSSSTPCWDNSHRVEAFQVVLNAVVEPRLIGNAIHGGYRTSDKTECKLAIKPVNSALRQVELIDLL